MRTLVILIAAVILSSARGPKKKVTVAVAANAQYAMKEIETGFEKETGIELEVIVGSSGKLSSQIRQSAPYDVFLSADEEFPNVLHKEGLTHCTPKIYATGRLVLWTLKDIDISDPALAVKNEKVSRVAIANPKVAPYGEAAVEVLKFFKVYDHAEPKLVFGESISQVNQYIYSEAADIGFTAKSVVLSPEMKGKGKWIEISTKAYRPIPQAAVILKSAGGRNLKEAQAFFDYVFTGKAGSIFKKYGYEIK